MRAHTRTRRTKSEQLHEDEIAISADEIIKKISGDLPKWAVMMKGLRYREGLTQAELGKKMDIRQSNISLMERGKRPICKQIAKRLADFFHTDYRLFL